LVKETNMFDTRMKRASDVLLAFGLLLLLAVFSLAWIDVFHSVYGFLLLAVAGCGGTGLVLTVVASMKAFCGKRE